MQRLYYNVSAYDRDQKLIYVSQSRHHSHMYPIALSVSSS